MPALVVVQVDFESAGIPEQFLEDVGKMLNDQRPLPRGPDFRHFYGFYFGMEIDRDADSDAAAAGPVEVETVHIQYGGMEPGGHLDLDLSLLDCSYFSGLDADFFIRVDKSSVSGFKFFQDR